MPRYYASIGFNVEIPDNATQEEAEALAWKAIEEILEKRSYGAELILEGFEPACEDKG